MAFRTERQLDEIDWSLLQELQADGRLSYNELGRRVNLSSPAVAERVRRLEEAGVIAGYHARVDAEHAGFPVAAFVQMRCDQDRCLLKTSTASDYPEVVEVHKLSGDHCSMLKVRAGSMAHIGRPVDSVRGPSGRAPLRRLADRDSIGGLEQVRRLMRPETSGVTSAESNARDETHHGDSLSMNQSRASSETRSKAPASSNR